MARLVQRPIESLVGWREVIREVAEAEVESWRDGERLVMRDRMRALTFEVIVRAVFGVTERERIERLLASLRRRHPPLHRRGARAGRDG
jgi:hypothetical protein